VLAFELDGKTQKVSTGLTQEQADAFTADPALIVGQHIEVEAMGLTSTGLLREPRFKGIRTDV
jgi:DNA ligase-1